MKSQEEGREGEGESVSWAVGDKRVHQSSLAKAVTNKMHTQCPILSVTASSESFLFNISITAGSTTLCSSVCANKKKTLHPTDYIVAIQC